MGEPAAAPSTIADRALRAATQPLVRLANSLAHPEVTVSLVRNTATSQAWELASAVATIGLWPLGLTAPRPGEDGAGAGEGSGVVPLSARRSVPADVPVLLVHGYGANRSNWHFVERRLRAAGFGSVHAVNYNPLTSDLPGLAQWFAGEVVDLRKRTGADAVHVVGHSLGGVVARYALQILGVDGVATCVTLASPHGGVTLARPMRPLPGGLGAVARQLRPDAPEMVLLRSSARPLATRFVAVAGGADLIVPTGRALIREPELGATNLVVPHHGHFSLLFSPSMADAIAHQLLGSAPSSNVGVRFPAAA